MPAGLLANNAPDKCERTPLHPGHYYSGNTRGASIIQAIEAKDDWTLAEAQNCSSTTIPRFTRRTATCCWTCWTAQN